MRLEAVEAPWRTPQVLFGIVAAFLLMNFGVIAVVAIAGTTSGVGVTLGGQFVLESALIAVPVGIAISRASAPWTAALGLRKAGWRALGLAALTFFAYLAFAVLYAAWVTAPEQRDLAQELGFDESAATAILAGIVIVGIAPFAEEVFFRGFVYGGLRHDTGPWIAAGVSGLLFGIIHLTTGEISVVPPLAVLGFLLALLYERTGSLWPPILVHGINNALAFTVLVAD